MINNWIQLILEILESIRDSLVLFIPKLLGAILVFVIGWFIAIVIEKIIAVTLARLKFNQIFERTGWKEALEKAELKVKPSEFIGAIGKWIVVIVFLSLAIDILGFTQFAVLLNKFIAWLPNLIVAIAIFIVAVIVADIIEKIVRASIERIGVKYAGFFGTVSRWAIYIFAGLTILSQLKVGIVVINALVYGFVGMIALAVGLAFGLGSKEAAAKIIEDIKKKISEK